jgi:hypothetical protein
MGNAPMLESIGQLQPAPDGVVVASAFNSLKEAGLRHGIPKYLMFMMPDVWDNVRAVSQNHAPLLVVHSDADTANGLSMGRQIFDAAREPKQWVALHGFRHNDLYTQPSEQWWAPVLRFIQGSSSQ